MKKTVAVDMDGVIADVEAHFLNWYERDYGVKMTKDDLLGKSEEEAFPEKGLVRNFASTEGFFSTVPVMPGAVEALRKLQEHFEIYIVSAAMEFPQSLVEKRQWLREHFPFISWKNIVLCGDKSIINTDFMVDDHIKNLDYCQGKPIMFQAFHNLDHDHHVRATNWDEVIEILMKEV